MSTALVMGITGSFGGHVAQELARQGWSIRALMRNPVRLPSKFSSVEVFKGDAADIDSIRAAAQGADLIVYGVNPPYCDWPTTVVPWLDNTATVAEELGMTVVFPGNVYIFDPADGPEFDESARAHPVTAKGVLRQTMEVRLQLAAQHGARVIIVRAGDFIAAGAKSAWLQSLIKKTKNGYALSAPAERNLTHTWAYLPDLARTVAALVARRDTLASFSVFHFRGYRLSFSGLAEALRAASGQEVVLKAFPWWVLRLAAPFSTFVRSLFEMRYLWQHELNLPDAKLRAALQAHLAPTPVEQALLEIGLVSKR
ncbi:MAG: NAD(P)H-binding protein [Gammaproteobacteria bacterium]|nr:NAD(P)H-binding protein [Gammaproteobacteria bacterium]